MRRNRKRRQRNRALAAKSPRMEHLDLCGSAAVTLTAAAEGQTPKIPTFAINAYNGGAMRVPRFELPVIVDMKGLKASPRVPVLLDHKFTQIVGQSKTVIIDADGVKVAGDITGDYTKDGSAANHVVSHARNGFQWQASVGVNVGKVQRVRAGDSVEVNGKTFEGPVLVARTGQLREVSFTAVGADPSSSASVAANAAGSNAMSFEKWLAAKGFDADTITEEQRTSLQAMYDADVEAKGTSEDDEDDEEKGEKKPAKKGPKKIEASDDDDDDEDDDEDTEAERRLTAAATTATRAEHVRINRISRIAGDHPDIQAKAIEKGWTVEATELAVLRAKRAPSAGIRRDTPELTAAAIEASMLRAQGISSERLEEWFDEKVLDAADKPDLRGMSLHGLLFTVIQAAGMHVRPGRVDNQTIEAAFRADIALRASAGFTTLSLSGILANLANKGLLDRFASMDSVVPEIAYETDTNDFKPFTRYRLDSTGSFTEVGADGELKHIPLSDSTFSNQLKTLGGMIALTRQMMTNDDLGAFLQIPQIFGELALHAREQAVATKVLANTGSFFSAGNGNYISGASTVIGVAGYDTATQKFREQKNAGGKFMMQAPKKVLVPPAIEAEALRMFKSQTTSILSASQKPQSNVYEGRYKPVVSPYFGTASGLTNASDTAWYLLGDPSAAAAIVQVGYLRGQRTPVIESGQADFSVLGMQWRSFYDFGVALFEQRAGVLSKGGA